MEYAVVYFNEQGQDKYVGSVSDYKAEEFSANPILMGLTEAHDLVVALQNYVRNEECKDNEAALFAFEDGRWGFYVDNIDIDDYMGALVNYGGDPLLIEDEVDAASLAKAIERAQYGIREIEKDSEEWYSALKELDLADVNDVKHIYSGVDGSEFIFCKSEDWDLPIDTLQGLADYINSDDYNQLVVNRIIEANGWTDLCGENDYDVCEYNGQKVTLDENTGKAIVV